MNSFQKVRRFLDLEAEVYEDEEEDDDGDEEEGQDFDVCSML